MIEFLARWFDARLGAAKFTRKVMNHVFPDHWSFMLGEIALYSFVVLVITGVFLAVFYQGSSVPVIYHGAYRPLRGVRMSAAYHSVLRLSFSIPAGLLFRQMHHWAADIFIAAIFAHLARIYFTAAYRKPRELNWLIGLTMLLLALANGFFGYSLCDDVLSGAGLRVGYAILLSVPVVGPWLAFLVFGGTSPNPATLPRMFAWHIFFIPAALAFLILAHLGIIWRQMHANYPGAGGGEKLIVGSRFWPVYTMKSLALFFGVFAGIAALGGWVQIDPVWVYGPYNPIGIVPGAQPDWYLGWVEGAMRLFPGVNGHVGRWLIPELFFPGFLFPALVFAFLYCYPFLEQWLCFDFRGHNVLRRPWEMPWATALGCAGLAFVLVLEIAGGDDVIAVAMGSSVIVVRRVLRVLAIVAPLITGWIIHRWCEAARRKHAHPREALAGANAGYSEAEIAPQPRPR